MDALRFVVHLSAAIVWIGAFGYTLVEPPSRTTRVAGIAALVVLIASGMWSVASAEVATSTLIVQVMLLAKITLAILSAASAVVQLVTRRADIGRWAGVSTVAFAVAAALIGFQLSSAL